jgi:hypothetical protein
MRTLVTFLMLLLIGYPNAHAAKPTAKSSSAANSAHRAVAKEILNVRSFDEFLALSAKHRELYLSALEQLIEELAASDVAEQTDYQAANSNWDFFGTIIESAVADGEDRRCIYAGTISELDINGRYCMRPRDQGCSPKITCNPLLYGSGVCVSARTRSDRVSASRNCAKSPAKKSVAQVIKEIESKREEWDAFRSDLNGYCESPRPSQKGLCASVASRVARIEAVIGQGNVVPAATRSTAPVPKPPEPREQPVTAADSGNAVSIRPVEPAKPAAQPAAEPATAPARTVSVEPTGPGLVKDVEPYPAVTAPGSRCDRYVLSYDLQNSSDSSACGNNLMSLTEAQLFMCTKPALQQSWVNEVRKMLAYKLQQASRLSAYKSYARSEALGQSANFEACLKEAVAIRNGASYTDTGLSSEIRIAGYDPSKKAYDQCSSKLSGSVYGPNGESLGMTEVPKLGSWMKLKNLSICKVKVSHPYISQPKRFNPSGVPATNRPAAQ